jgi:hypothetical protein
MKELPPDLAQMLRREIRAARNDQVQMRRVLVAFLSRGTSLGFPILELVRIIAEGPRALLRTSYLTPEEMTTVASLIKGIGINEVGVSPEMLCEPMTRRDSSSQNSTA